MTVISIDAALDQAGTGPYQRRLLAIFGLVWTADAMQVLAVGFTAASIATSFGLTLPQALQAGTLFFLGMLIGAAFCGKLADRYGRRRVLIFTVTCDAIFGTLAVFSPDFTSLVVLRFLTGFAVGGTLPVDYAMMAEFLPAKNRGRWLVMLEGFWAVGTLLVALTAWLTSLAGLQDGWRYILAVNAVPAIIGVGLRFMVPESPLYLLRQGRADEAKAVLNKVLAGNRKPSLEPAVSIQVPAPVESIGLFSPELRQRSIMMLVIWFLVSISYYGIFTWMPAKLAADGFGFVRGYGFLVLVALAQIPGYVLAAYGVEAWGRKPTLIIFCVLSAFGCLLFTVAEASVLVGVALLLMSFALLGAWGALYAYTPELYPTASRATGMGAAGAVARLAGLLAPLLMASVISNGFGFAIGTFAALLALAAAAAFFIDAETKEISLT